MLPQSSQDFLMLAQELSVPNVDGVLRLRGGGRERASGLKAKPIRSLNSRKVEPTTTSQPNPSSSGRARSNAGSGRKPRSTMQQPAAQPESGSLGTASAAISTSAAAEHAAMAVNEQSEGSPRQPSACNFSMGDSAEVRSP